MMVEINERYMIDYGIGRLMINAVFESLFKSKMNEKE